MEKKLYFIVRVVRQKKKKETTLPTELIKLTSRRRREGSTQSVYAIENVIFFTIYIKHISRVSTTTINNKSLSRRRSRVIKYCKNIIMYYFGVFFFSYDITTGFKTIESKQFLNKKLFDFV